MKISAVAWIVAGLLIVAGVIWTTTKSHPTPQNNIDQTHATSTDTAAIPQIPGDNLALGSTKTAELGAYLIGYNGMTVYMYTPDNTNVSTCTGPCTDNWPPYIVTSSNLVAESPIAGTVGTTTRADGAIQLTYNGHPLYFYKGDTSPEQTSGQGVGKVWYVVKP